MRLKTILLLLCFALSQSGNAHAQSNSKDQPQGDLSVLQTDVTAIQAEQQQIITRLDELKQLLQVNSRAATPGAMPGPQPPSTLDIRGEQFEGGSAARVALIEYSDFECPFCGGYERETSPQIFDNYIKTGKVKLYYRDLPLSMHPHALQAARAARCAGEQDKYWEMHDSLFARQNALSDPALLDRAKTLGLDTQKFGECFSSDRYRDDIQKSLAEAQKLGIQGTPTFFIGTIDSNGDVVNITKRINGAHPYADFQPALDEVLNSNSQQAVSGH
jgi:protein-disulfide isomerase